jgi:beta-aspartyl-peptidase (threonine type)
MTDEPTAESQQASFERGESRWVILVHGGAGEIAPERAPVHVQGCAAAAEIGAKVLRDGGTALDAVEAAVRALEDDPNFNAGTGAALNEEGGIELDASIMEGISLRAGAVAALPPFRNPIAIARAALEDGRHVLYAGEGAARFAEEHGFSRATLEEMRTERAQERLRQVHGQRGSTNWSGGTVGAVARDGWGHVASATSTGGTVDKRVGRVGDSPLVGAGTYADDLHGACSTTGHGESFIRTSFAARAVGQLATAPAPGSIASRTLDLLDDMTKRVGGNGGAILVDREGRSAWARNTKAMSWALVRRLPVGDEEQRDGGA